MPPIVVTGRDDQVTSRHKQHAEAKIAKLERYFDGIVKIEVVLGHLGGPGKGAPGGSGGTAEAEVVLSVRGGKPVVCHSRQDDLYAAIDTVLDKAEVQLTRHKEKLKTHKGAPTSRHPEEIPGGDPVDAGPEEPEETSYQDIVEERDYPPTADGPPTEDGP
jgi:putative sigma-54 modulation protein